MFNVNVRYNNSNVVMASSCETTLKSAILKVNEQITRRNLNREDLTMTTFITGSFIERTVLRFVSWLIK